MPQAKRATDKATPDEGKFTASRFSADDVREGILHCLFTGQFVPGQKLIEADLVHRFARPRSYVRDALLRLESEGIVEIITFRGAYIRAFTVEQARNIDLTFTALFALAARQAAERIGLADFRDQLSRALQALSTFEPTGGLHDYALARERFCRLIIAISGNEEIARVCPIMQGHIVRVQSNAVLSEEEHRSRLTYYQTIAAAIDAGDAARAEQAVWRYHAYLSRDIGSEASSRLVAASCAAAPLIGS